MRLVLALIVLFPLSAFAQDEADPTYDECFALMQKKMEAAQAAVDAEGAAVQAMAPTAPASQPSDTQKQINKALENGVPVEIDPFDANGQTVEGKIDITVNKLSEDDTPPVITREKKCKTLYGLTF